MEQLTTAVSLGGHQVVVADLASACCLAGRHEEAAAILHQLLELRRRAIRAGHLPGAGVLPRR